MENIEFDDLDHMPEWEEFVALGRNDECEENLSLKEIRAQRKKNEIAKLLYNQSRSLYRYSTIFCEALRGEMAEMTTALIMQNTMVICPKILSAEAVDNYVARMECASIIRTNCKELELQIKAADMFNMCSSEYRDVIFSELDKFKSYFLKWVKLFKKDNVKDDWGLYK